jgi:NAD(P)-dependent dehydrogenase (short-subunit alcohol dehydrogenase family)
VNGKIVVIIGGTSGIGHEVSRQAILAGARLIITGRDANRLDDALRRLGVPTKGAVLDAHDEIALERFFSEVGTFDHLVSMVGDSAPGGFLSTSPDVMRRVLNSKFWSNWLIARLAAKKLQLGGSIVFTSGTGGQPHEAAAGIVGNLALGALVQGLSRELAPNIRVNAVAPTFMGTATGFWREMPSAEVAKLLAAFNLAVPLKRLARVEEVASTYLHLMTNGFITGQVMAVDGGLDGAPIGGLSPTESVSAT